MSTLTSADVAILTDAQLEDEIFQAEWTAKNGHTELFRRMAKTQATWLAQQLSVRNLKHK